MGLLRRQSRSRSGASAVEFAVVAPVFFLVVLGIIEFGRMVMVQQVITNAAREGARIAVLDDSTTAKVTQRVNDYLSAARLAGATINVSPSPPSSAKYDQPVSVEVRLPFSEVSLLSRPFFSKATVLTANSVMRRETVE